MRFDDPLHVKQWRETGAFPAIHRRLAELVIGQAQGRTFMDLCASTGLMGRQLVDRGFKGCSIEASEKLVTAGAYGNDLQALVLKLLPTNLPDVVSWMRICGVQLVVARRCLPELDDAGVTPALLAEALIEGGATELFIEGRVPTPRATHRLSTIELEVEALSDRFELVLQEGPCAYLRVRGS